MVNAQEWLDRNYPEEERKEITKLDIGNKSLESSLDLSDFVNLEELDCRDNKLTELRLNNCLKLKRLYCHDNRLIELKINHLVNIVELGCRKNQLTKLDLPNPNQID